MRKSTKTAIAFLVLAGMAGSVAMAGDRSNMRHEAKGPGGGQQMRFERIDIDRSGDVSFEEFSAVIGSRASGADANADGKITVAELADAIERRRAERRAERMIRRFDTNGDGELTMEEIENRQKKMFALMDRNDDGVLVIEEMPRRMGMRGEGRHGKRWHDRGASKTMEEVAPKTDE